MTGQDVVEKLVATGLSKDQAFDAVMRACGAQEDELWEWAKEGKAEDVPAWVSA